MAHGARHRIALLVARVIARQETLEGLAQGPWRQVSLYWVVAGDPGGPSLGWCRVRTAEGAVQQTSGLAQAAMAK